MKTHNIFFFLIIGLIGACSAPKELIVKAQKSKIIQDCKEADYLTIFPELSFENWLNDFNNLISDLPVEVKRNQIGMSSTNENIQEFWCFPSARPFVHLDTITKLKNAKNIIGVWKIICNRTIEFKDSVSYSDSVFYRTSKELKTLEDEVLVQFTETHIKFYVRKKNSNSYLKKFSRQYKILNGRYLLIYNNLKTTSGTAFVGVNNEGELIWNQYSVNMYTKRDVFKRWTTILNQMIFKRI